MAKPADSVVPILQQIQKTLAEHTRRFDKIDQRMEDMHDSTTTTLGLAGHPSIRHDGVNERLEDLTRRVEDLERTK